MSSVLSFLAAELAKRLLTAYCECMQADADSSDKQSSDNRQSFQKEVPPMSPVGQNMEVCFCLYMDVNLSFQCSIHICRIHARCVPDWPGRSGRITLQTCMQPLEVICSCMHEAII